MVCDLHTHSTYSDGTCTPEQIIKLAKQNNVAAVALTDHNTVSGLKEFIGAAKENNIIAVAGAEFSTDYNGKELHILGLFIDESAFDTLTEVTDDYQIRKEQSNIELVSGLKEKGYAIDYTDIKSKNPDGSVNRANIAMALKEKGYVSSVDEAFNTVLSKSYGLYHPPKRISSVDMIRIIKNCGALPVLAHPFINLTEQECRKYLPAFIENGLVGMEAYYSLYNESVTLLAEKICEEFNIEKSGGSDFHGTVKPDISLGTGKGNLKVPFEIYEKLAGLKVG